MPFSFAFDTDFEMTESLDSEAYLAMMQNNLVEVTRDGREIRKRRYFFSETFAAIGCAEFYRATGEKEAWERAES